MTQKVLIETIQYTVQRSPLSVIHAVVRMESLDFSTIKIITAQGYTGAVFAVVLCL